MESLGIPTAPNPDGSPNLIVAVTYALLTEMYRAQTEDAVVQGCIQSGNMQILSQGANSGGPVISTGTNILPTHLYGVIQ